MIKRDGNCYLPGTHDDLKLKKPEKKEVIQRFVKRQQINHCFISIINMYRTDATELVLRKRSKNIQEIMLSPLDILRFP